MSFQASYQLPKYPQPQNNLSSPNLYGNFRKSDLTIQLDNRPQQPIITNSSYSQRHSANLPHGQISYDMQVQRSARQPNGDHKGKINEMSSDLAKLKQQLSKIMSQAGSMEKRPMSTNQSGWSKNSQEMTSQSFSQPRFVDEFNVNPVNVSINKSQQRSSLQHMTSSPQSFQRFTESNKQLPPQSPSISQKPFQTLQQPTPAYTNLSQKKQQKVTHSQSQKGLGSLTNKYASYSTSQDLNSSFGASELSVSFKNPEQSNGGYYFGKNYDIKIDNSRPILKVREEVSQVNNFVSSNVVKNDVSKSTNEYNKNEYHYPQQQQQQATKSQQEQKQKQKQKPFQQTLSPAKIQQPPSSQQPFTFYSPQSLTKKSSSNPSHQLIVNRIVNEQLSKKFQQSLELSQLKKKKQQQQYQYQEKIIELQHEKRKLKHEISSVLLEKENIQMALNTEKAQKEALNKRYLELEEVFKTTKFELQQSKTRYKVIQRKLQSQLSRTKVITSPLSFDQALRQQIQQITKLKQQVQDKQEQIMRVKQINTSHRRQIQSLHNQIKIQQLKAASQLNQCQQKHSILIQDKQNQIKTMKNMVITLEAKLDCAIKENKTKDAFMVQHLTGKIRTGEEKQYIQNFFKSYEIQFPTNKIAEKLKEELYQIQRLKKTILEMAGNKL